MPANLKSLALCVVSLVFSSGAGQGGVIDRACMNSERSAISPRKCACLQWVADESLSANFQDRVASIIGKPDESQKTRQSPFSADERFWLHYKHYGLLVQAHCKWLDPAM